MLGDTMSQNHCLLSVWNMEYGEIIYLQSESVGISIAVQSNDEYQSKPRRTNRTLRNELCDL